MLDMLVAFLEWFFGEGEEISSKRTALSYKLDWVISHDHTDRGGRA